MHCATTAPPQEQQRHVAEVLQLRGCFGAKKGSRPVLPVLDAAAAAAWAQVQHSSSAPGRNR
jgi:hypothetical protein